MGRDGRGGEGTGGEGKGREGRGGECCGFQKTLGRFIDIIKMHVIKVTE